MKHTETRQGPQASRRGAKMNYHRLLPRTDIQSYPNDLTGSRTQKYYLDGDNLFFYLPRSNCPKRETLSSLAKVEKNSKKNGIEEETREGANQRAYEYS